MMSRYFVVVKIPVGTVELIKKYFWDKFHKEMRATHVHMSLLPPFYLSEGLDEAQMLESIKKIDWRPFEASFIGIRKSEQRERKYLFLSVGPEEKCQWLSAVVEEKLKNMIYVDKKPYLNEEVPPFEAHVTIDYNFDGESPSEFPIISFVVDKISVAKEVDGKWVDLVVEKI